MKPWTPESPIPARFVEKVPWSGRLPRIYLRALDVMVGNPNLFPGYPVGSKEDIVAEALRNYLPWGQEGVGDAFKLGMELERATAEEQSRLVEFTPPQVTFSPTELPRRRPGRPPTVLRVPDQPAGKDST